MDVKKVIEMCEEMFDDCSARTVKDLGRHYGVAMGPKESRYVGGMVLFVDKKTGEIDAGRRNEIPKGSTSYIRGETVWENTQETEDGN